jgi:hypothetical protein
LGCNFVAVLAWVEVFLLLLFTVGHVGVRFILQTVWLLAVCFAKPNTITPGPANGGCTEVGFTAFVSGAPNLFSHACPFFVSSYNFPFTWGESKSFPSLLCTLLSHPPQASVLWA